MARDPFEDLEVLETELVDPFEDLEKLRGRRQATIDAPDPAEEQFLRPAWEAKQRLAGFGRFVEEQTGKVKEDIGGLFGRRVGDFIDVEGKMERVVRRDPDAGTIETESGVYPAIIPMTEEQREYHGASELSQIGRSVGAALFGYPIDIMAFIGGHVPRALGEPEALVPEGVREPRTALLKEDIKGFEQLAKTLPLRAQYELYKAAGVEDPSQYTHALNPGVAAANAIEAVFGFLTGQVPDMKQSQEDIRRIVAQSQEEEQISAFGTHILAGGVRPLTTKRVRPGEPTTAAVRAQMRVDPSQSAPVQAAMEKMIKQEEAFWEFRESMVETFGTRPLEKLAGREKVGFDALVEKAVAKKKPAKKKPAKKVAKKPAGTAGSFTALVESHITPNKTLSRGLDYYGTLLKDMPTLELTKVMRWAEKHEMPYIRKRLGGNIEAEIRLRTTAQLKLKKPPKKRAPKPVKPKPAAKQPWEMTRKEYSWHVPKGTMYHQTGKGIVSKIETEGFRLDRPVARIGDDVMPDAVFMKPQPTDISVGGKIGETAQLEVLPKKGLLTKEFADRVKLEEYLKQDKEYARLKRISEELDKKQAKEIESVPLDDPALESKIEAMIQVSNRAATKARKRGTDFLREQGIEAIKIRKDRGFLGRSTETLGVLDPKNVTIVSHRKIIQQALSEGKPVPAEVLKDYPELGKKASKLKAAGKIVGGAAVTYAVLDKERREEIAGLGIPATFFIGSKRATRAAVSSMKKVNISALKELYSQHSVPPKLRPGYKQAISEIRAIKSDVAKSLNITLRQTPEGRLIAPSGQGKILAKATEVEKRRRDLSLARQHGIATRLTKSGKDVPAVRKSGVFVHEDFATYDKFKDIRSGPLGGTKDPIRFAQEIEGSLSVQQQAKLPEQQGPMMRFVESPRRQYEMLRQDFHTEQSKVLHSILDPLTKKERKQVTDLLESVVSNRAASIDVNTLA
ncbi:hypothetical protein KAR91_05560, partial [Candidatus Pacearchaeota archaeon]|nr:hypothetical protein [Candidatus Pacearchaeota archaeon]